MTQFLKYSACLLILLSGCHFSLGSNFTKEQKEQLVQGYLNLGDELITKSLIHLKNCGTQENETVDSDGYDRETTLRFLELGQKMIRESKILFPLCDTSDVYVKPADCSEVLKNGNTQSGLYSIWPRSRVTNGNPLTVYCDMETDGGGWTVIQRRGNFTCQKNFYQDWEQYKTGFGYKDEEFWLGNDYIHALTNQADNEVRFDLEDTKGERGYAKYSSFWIDSEDSSYALHISNYTGNVGDCMKHHNNMKFSTKDRGSTKFAKLYKGGWWYSNWAHSNLNGRMKPGQDSIESIHWWYWRSNKGLASVEIKVRPN